MMFIEENLLIADYLIRKYILCQEGNISFPIF